MSTHTDPASCSESPIIIVGGGWAGLSAAIHLTHAGHSVHLLEASRQLGGRARSGKIGNFQIDNGQHISLGACQETLQLLKLLEISETQIFKRQPLNLKIFDSTGQEAIHIQANQWPAPFHLIYAISKAKGLSCQEKFQLIKIFAYFAIKRYRLSFDRPLLKLLNQHHQSERLIQNFWEPLCLSIMNTPIANASAEIFLSVLNKSFSHQRDFSDLLLFKNILNDSLAKPTQEYLLERGNKISISEKVTRLRVSNNRIHAVQTTQTEYSSDKVILATPRSMTAQLLTPFPECSEIVDNLNQMKDEPIYTIYLFYSVPVQLPEYMLGMIHTLSHWIFDHHLTNQPRMLAVVISGPGKHQELTKAELIQSVDDEIRSFHPQLPTLQNAQVVIEKKATLSSVSGVNQLRPPNHTAIHGLYLAGDYTQTGYPSTLEGAVLSGKQASQNITESPQNASPIKSYG